MAADEHSSDEHGEDHHPRSDVSGAANDVVQARDIHGGVHLHNSTAPPRPVPRQLPGNVSSFVNRLAELRRLDALLDPGDSPERAVGVYVITGTAGVGKTSLALHWAHRVRHRFPDGQLYVNLRGYDPGPPVTPEQALDQFLRALGVPPANIPVALADRSALLRSLLAERRTLVILDNAATASQVRPLLPGTSACLVLVTSRHRFSGLVARDGAQRLVLDLLSEADAVELLRTVMSDYRTKDETVDLVELARLCARLPLALRIAAERASSRPLMQLDELIGDLRDESALWDALAAEQDDEADAVRSVFAWSYRALPPQAARLFCLLGLHPGPEFGIAAAAAMLGVEPAVARRQLDALVGAHMIEQPASGRFQFHDLLRAYAAQQAQQQEDSASRLMAVVRVLHFYAHTLASAVLLLAPQDRLVPLHDFARDVRPLSFTDRGVALNWFILEHANLIAGIRIATAHEFFELAWCVAAMLRGVQERRNTFGAWFETARLGLKAARRTGHRYGEAEMLDSLGKANLQSQLLVESSACHEEALRIRREIGDRFGEGVSINAFGLLAWRRRRLFDARDRFTEAMLVFRELSETQWQAVIATNLGMTQYELLDVTSAVGTLIRAAAAHRKSGNRAYEGSALFHLSMAQRESGDLGSAMSSIHDAMEIAEQDTYHAWGAFWLLEFAQVQRACGDPADALISYQRSAAVQRGLGDRNREAMALDGTGEAYRELGRPDQAAAFHRMAIALYRETGDRWAHAQALANLGFVLDDDAARPYREEAARLLVDFDDPRAVRLRDSLGSAGR
ncbi:tetratricopeptide repeat protein [Actinokineospora sp. NBRC 105648]|uniref:ATP-binding protein n=1 Tax=Actinokineospora sp. NBRC 105648 TaxID=3032206 RepID=UPI0024A08150|nr:tetratricopeptide repeat protein [Actinokineospora sp. NBRC 105648]GLZ39022.1 hypothetical protein Acsp05_26460 [Actinokineospora sp. NBRC 105648]